MYAVVSSGGKQYRVEAGSLLTLERLDGEPGASFTFDRVLLIGDGDSVTVGTPVVAGASVSATVIGETLGPKLVIFKFKQKVKYRRRNGHRQHLTQVRIDAINPTEAKKAAAGKATEPEGAAPEAKAPEKPMAKAKAAPRAPRPTAAKAATPKAPAKVAAPKAPAKVAAPRTSAKKAAATPTPAAEKPKPRRSAKPRTEE